MKYDPKTAFGNVELIAELKGQKKIGNLCPECRGDAAIRDPNGKVISPCARCKGRGIV